MELQLERDSTSLAQSETLYGFIKDLFSQGDESQSTRFRYSRYRVDRYFERTTMERALFIQGILRDMYFIDSV
jgi:hypothetical protein